MSDFDSFHVATVFLFDLVDLKFSFVRLRQEARARGSRLSWRMFPVEQELVARLADAARCLHVGAG